MNPILWTLIKKSIHKCQHSLKRYKEIFIDSAKRDKSNIMDRNKRY